MYCTYHLHIWNLLVHTPYQNYSRVCKSNLTGFCEFKYINFVVVLTFVCGRVCTCDTLVVNTHHVTLLILPRPSLNFSCKYFPNLLELLFMTVAAFPNASKSGFTLSENNHYTIVKQATVCITEDY